MKLFVTGATGYIGGDALYAIANAGHGYEITALVRNTEKGAQIASQYPSIRLVYGDLDSTELLEEEASRAEIVCHWADADHEVAARALVKGLASRSSPGFLIHTSGTGILMFQDLESKTYGESSLKIYNDWDGVKEMFTGIPDSAPHRNVDKVVQEGASDHVNTAIVCPPCIYGPGRGPGNKVSVQIPGLARCTLQQGHGIRVGVGKTFWTKVHVQDLSELYLKLVIAAAAGGGEPKTWNEGGYYFCESGDIAWGEVARQVAHTAHKLGYIKEDKVEQYSAEEANKLEPWAAMLWGCNSRSRAVRAKTLLDWKPTHPDLKDELEATIKLEAKKLNVDPGHAKVAAGEA